MMWVLTKKEEKEHLRELLKFCKDNQCIMYNYMNVIKNIRNECNRQNQMEKRE